MKRNKILKFVHTSFTVTVMTARLLLALNIWVFQAIQVHWLFVLYFMNILVQLLNVHCSVQFWLVLFHSHKCKGNHKNEKKETISRSV